MINCPTFLSRTELEWSTSEEHLHTLLNGIDRAIREEILPQYTLVEQKNFLITNFTISLNPLHELKYKVRITLPPFYEDAKTEERFRKKLQELLGQYTNYQIA